MVRNEFLRKLSVGEIGSTNQYDVRLEVGIMGKRRAGLRMGRRGPRGGGLGSVGHESGLGNVEAGAMLPLRGVLNSKVADILFDDENNTRNQNYSNKRWTISGSSAFRKDALEIKISSL